MKTRNGFTLIELLAVIVILAIIALIAIPIVLKLVEDAEKSAFKVSAENYKKVVEQTLFKTSLDGSSGIHPNDCEINENGNLICVGVADEIEIEINGEKPKSGYLNLKKRQITNMRLVYDDMVFITTSSGDIINSEYELGEEVKIKNGVTLMPGMKWYVVGEDKDTVSLMLNFNPEESSWGTSSNEGPINVMQTTISMLDEYYKEYGESTGFELIKDYTYINNKDGKEYLYGYQKLEINNGKTTITSKNGETIQLTGDTYGRILSSEEYLNILRTMPGLSIIELKEYILKNISYINEEYKTNFTTVDEILEYMKFENDYIYIYLIAYVIDSQKDGKYNEIMPKQWVYDYMYTEDFAGGALGYWLLTSRSNENDNTAQLVFTYGMCMDTDNLQTSKMVGPRPVVTVSKKKIEKVA